MSKDTLSVEAHLRKAIAYADSIRSICNLAAEESNAPGFGSTHEVVDWIFEAVQVLEKHLRFVNRTLPAQCLNLPVLTGSEHSAEKAGTPS